MLHRRKKTIKKKPEILGIFKYKSGSLNTNNVINWLSGNVLGILNNFLDPRNTERKAKHAVRIQVNTFESMFIPIASLWEYKWIPLRACSSPSRLCENTSEYLWEDGHEHALKGIHLYSHRDAMGMNMLSKVFTCILTETRWAWTCSQRYSLVFSQRRHVHAHRVSVRIQVNTFESMFMPIASLWEYKWIPLRACSCPSRRPSWPRSGCTGSAQPAQRAPSEGVQTYTTRETEMFYLTTHSTHFIYGYMASDIWLWTILIVRKETCCRHIGYSYRLTARVLLYACTFPLTG